MTKTFALLLDSYRELNAKRLFWIVLILSAMAVGACAMIGIRNGAITVMGYETFIKFKIFSMIEPSAFYKVIFSYLGIGLWLAWVANILALISTAGIFPDFMAGGSIDLYLSKPIGRLRLFFTKYIGGLLFVTLQVTVFAVCSFLMLGLRGKTWEPAIFLSIPLVVLVFSYLFSICVLLGVVTRSTIAALLLTLLVWAAIGGLQYVEYKVMQADRLFRVQTILMNRQIDETKAELAAMPATTQGSDDQSKHAKRNLGFFSHENTRADLESRLDKLQSDLATVTSVGTKIDTATHVGYYVVTPMPKPTSTTDLIDRVLFSKADLPKTDEESEDTDNPNDVTSGPINSGDRAFIRKTFETERLRDEHQRSTFWVIGTSLGFEALLVAWSAWLFCRRDY